MISDVRALIARTVWSCSRLTTAGNGTDVEQLRVGTFRLQRWEPESERLRGGVLVHGDLGGSRRVQWMAISYAD